MLRLNMIEYAKTFLGNFYRWGGDDPSGFDCSGFAIECLRSVGLVDEDQDLTAHGLLMKFSDKKVLVLTYQTFPSILPDNASEPGNLIFALDEQQRANHVEIILNKLQTIGASGGNSTTTTLEKAIKQNAFIKIRPVSKFKNKHHIIIVDPFLGQQTHN